MSSQSKKYEFPNRSEWRLDSRVGPLHREDGPAIEWDNGTKSWFLNGVRHREDGPAYSDRELDIWYFNGMKHRTNGPAVKSKVDSSEEWFFNDVKHRLDGPAVTAAENYVWYKEGVIHREDGPALITPNQRTYYINGEHLTKEEWTLQTRANKLEDILELQNITNMDANK